MNLFYILLRNLSPSFLVLGPLLMKSRYLSFSVSASFFLTILIIESLSFSQFRSKHCYNRSIHTLDLIAFVPSGKFGSM